MKISTVICTAWNILYIQKARINVNYFMVGGGRGREEGHSFWFKGRSQWLPCDRNSSNILMDRYETCQIFCTWFEMSILFRYNLFYTIVIYIFIYFLTLRTFLMVFQYAFGLNIDFMFTSDTSCIFCFISNLVVFRGSNTFKPVYSWVGT